jgi:hypothetical protein
MRERFPHQFLPAIVAFVFCNVQTHLRAASDKELAKQLQNPVASLISVPFQNNSDFGGGYNDQAFRYQLNFQPVVPISIGEDWNIISRTILPFIHQDGYIPAVQKDGSLRSTSQTGLGDLPNPLPGGIIAGAGPVFAFPTATREILGAGKWGLGPSVVVLRQHHGWTYGALIYQVWSYAGDSARDDISYTFLQPFLSYTTKTSTSFTINTESVYDWEHEQWTVPINFMVSQVLKVEGLPVSLQLGARYYAEAPVGSPSWGLRFHDHSALPHKVTPICTKRTW